MRSPETRRKYQIKCRYGISADDYDRLFDEQDGKCAICSREPVAWQGKWKGRLPRLVVDHDHDTGRVRGLLCGSCNRALGILGDNLAGISRVAAYLFRAR
jgi:hypothetical protein